MKKFIILTAVALLACATASAWDKYGHASIAKIAENHLTDKAKARITEYLHGRSIVYYASYPDYFKDDMLIDIGFDASNWDRMTTYPHTYTVDENGVAYRTNRVGDKYIKNSLYYIDLISKQLEEPEKLTDSARIASIFCLVHFVGDMHCPMHIRIPEDDTIGKFTVYLGKKATTMHVIWDQTVLHTMHPWSFSDCAYICDTFSPEQIAECTKGDVYSWGEENVRIVRPLYGVYKDGDTLAPKYCRDNKEMAETQVAKAGYRLAKILNNIFDK